MSSKNTTRQTAQCRRHRRQGVVLIWCAFWILLLIGMVGLVVDGGLLMARHRQVQNAADAAALAAAFARFRGQTEADARTSGTMFVTDANHNNLPTATVQINFPPTLGGYQGVSGYVEAIVDLSFTTSFIRALGSTTGDVRGHAVAGGEPIVLGAGMMALDPNATPGLDITGTAEISVEGAVFVNSIGGGEDEWGESVGNGQVGSAISNNAEFSADEIFVSGGVNDLTNFDAETFDANTGEAYPDPLLALPTPMVSNGVVNIQRGSPQATSGGLQLNNAADTSAAPNYIDVNPITGEETMVLKPGIYESIKVTGGKVHFETGIYVLRPASNVTYTLQITGGVLTQDSGGLMFYNTGSDYDPVTGAPDINDGDTAPNASGSVDFGDVQINASVGLEPLDSGTFQNMLIYFRRWHDGRIQIEGNSDDGDISGTIYAKWAEAQLAGQGTLNTSFVVGQVDVSGQGTITINPDDDLPVVIHRVFLVE